jgi:hypothetical protein
MEVAITGIAKALKAVGKSVTGWEVKEGVVVIAARSKTRAAACPHCSCWSNRIHDRYVRRVAERPCLDAAVLIEIEVQRFKCPNPRCQCRTFAERIDTLAPSYQRRTQSQARALQAIGFAPGGAAAARRAHELGLRASRQTVLRELRRARPREKHPPRIIGIDDWAIAKGHTTAPSSSIWSAVNPLRCLPGARRWQWLHGCVNIPPSKSSPETVPARTRRPSRSRGLRPRKSLIGGTSSPTCARLSRECSIGWEGDCVKRPGGRARAFSRGPSGATPRPAAAFVAAAERRSTRISFGTLRGSDATVPAGRRHQIHRASHADRPSNDPQIHPGWRVPGASAQKPWPVAAGPLP